MYDATVQGSAEDDRVVVASTAAPLTVWARGCLIIEVWPRGVVGHHGTFHIRFVNPADTPAAVDVEECDAANTLAIDTGPVVPVIVPLADPSASTMTMMSPRQAAKPQASAFP